MIRLALISSTEKAETYGALGTRLHRAAWAAYAPVNSGDSGRALGPVQEAASAEALLRAFSCQSEEQLAAAVGGQPFTYLENQVVRLARALTLRSADVPVSKLTTAAAALATASRRKIGTCHGCLGLPGECIRNAGIDLCVDREKYFTPDGGARRRDRPRNHADQARPGQGLRPRAAEGRAAC